MGLTTKRIAKLRKRPRGRFHDGHGLYLQVMGPRSASWILRYVRHGEERMLGLGPLHVVGLAEARQRARAARLQLLDGIDPVEDRKAKKLERVLAVARTMTFSECAAAYFAQHESKWKNAKHAAQFVSTLKQYAGPINSLPVASIDTGLVLKCVEPHWATKTETMSRVRGRIEAVLDWATVRGYRTGDNPARWKGHLDQVLPARGSIAKVEHHAALPYCELPGFMQELQTREGVATRALEFTILTAARTGEVVGAGWDEIDFDAATWTIPARRMKASREHRVPLSECVLELLGALYREDGNPFVFIGAQQGGLSNMALAAVLKRMRRSNVTVHGFRSTFRDWAAERTNFANHVIEMALAHVIGDKVEASYRRGDLFEKRRKLMEAWAAYCQSPASGGAVVPLRSTVDA